jgi:hypothetical protein
MAIVLVPNEVEDLEGLSRLDPGRNCPPPLRINEEFKGDSQLGQQKSSSCVFLRSLPSQALNPVLSMWLTVVEDPTKIPVASTVSEVNRSLGGFSSRLK